MARPYWSGQVTISLVSFAVEIYPASHSARPFQFHEIDRATGQRIHHRNVAADTSADTSEDEDGEESRSIEDKDEHIVEKPDVVKGYEYKKGKYAIVEPDELRRLSIPGKKTLDIVQFSAADDIPRELYEKPYFVVPKDGPQTQAFAIVREGMRQTGKVALGEIVFSGREHVAALAPSSNPKHPGMMLYTLRFSEELRDPAKYFGKIKALRPDFKQVSLAKQLIETYTRPFELERFKDDYEAAVRALVKAKMEHKPAPSGEPERPKAKVIHLMDALRKSVAAGASADRAKAKEGTRRASDKSSKRKLKLVPPRRRKTA